MRYELDRLGWLNFEWLIQTWLKVEFGFIVGAWGGTRDLGRDAYAEESVASRSNGTSFKGPVVFQAKFVAQANARGSDYKTPLLAACNAEAKTIRRRVDEGLWVDPSTYVILTNCAVTSKDRRQSAIFFPVQHLLTCRCSVRVTLRLQSTFIRKSLVRFRRYFLMKTS